MRIQFKLTAVGIHLLADFLIENADSTLLPGLGIFEFRKKRACIKHALCLEKQVVALLGEVLHDVVGIAMIVH